MTEKNRYKELSGITTNLLAWYRQNARELPWRGTKDPYAIWVSEVMLQQTRVETVIPYYRRFLRLFPSITALAAASEEDVLKTWEGLGFYGRARLLLKGAKEVVSKFEGQLPADPESLQSLPGIGSYMAGSIASIAFELSVPAVDGNVVRLVTRLLAWEEDSGTANSKRVITNWVRERFPENKAGDFTQALMELGALICLPRNPCCSKCPLLQYCKAAGNNPGRFPVKQSAGKIPAERRIVLRISWNDRHLLIQRPQKGLMAGFWEYPSIVAGSREDATALIEQWSKENFGESLQIKFNCKRIHIYSHLRWNLEIYDGLWSGQMPPKEFIGGMWLSQAEEKKLPRVAFIRELE